MNNLLEINNLTKKFNTINGEIEAIDKINLEIKQGEIIAIVGSSGCGKSTLLSILSGLDKQTSGNFKFNDDVKIGYMLQQDALLPWLSIYENVLIGLKINKQVTKENLEYIDYLLKVYDLYEFKDKKPASLSGGMKQRVV